MCVFSIFLLFRLSSNNQKESSINMASRPKCAQNLHLFIDLTKKINTACRNLGMVLLLLLRVELCKFQQCEICMFNSAFMM